MFTGLVQSTGRVVGIEATEHGRRLRIDSGNWGHRPEQGDSIAVSGCCLTVAAPVGEDGVFVFDAIPETLSKTTLGSFVPGQSINLEHAVTASTPMGGHVVQGHVDETAEVVSVVTAGEWRVRLTIPKDLMKYMVPKGSVTLDGVSLTLATVDVAGGWIEVTLIPETLDRTTLRGWAAGDRVNLEADMMVKTIVHTMEHFQTINSGGQRG